MCFGLYAEFSLAEIYKYQDQQGKWHFSDTKPESEQTRKLETLSISTNVEKPSIPYVDVTSSGAERHYRAQNPFHAPVQVFFRFDNGSRKISKTLPPLATEVLAVSLMTEAKRRFHFSYVLGDPEAKPLVDIILPPFTSPKPMKITQGFRGQFSHYREPSLHAVDIRMPVGTKITAVQSGTVIGIKDDYHIAGVTSGFFFDKANYVAILHEDGSYAFYAHLLLGGVKVKPGQTVAAGEVIGLSGNTGYSTGPHLHFVVRHNAKGRSTSLPFRFRQPNKPALVPAQGEWLLPFTP